MLGRGQVTVEFIVVTGIVFAIFLVSFQFIADERRMASETLWSFDAQDSAEKLAHALNNAYLAGAGASLNVSLPSKLVGGIDYEITVYERMVSVHVPTYNRDFDWKYVTAAVDGASQGLSVEAGLIGVENINGTLKLTGYGG